MIYSLTRCRQFFARFIFSALLFGAVCTFPSALFALDTLRQQELLHLLRQDCGSCHGLRLLGGLGPPLTVSALQDKPKEYLEMVILNGVPERAMPPWKGLLTQEEITWLAERLLEGVAE
ncbi:c-type cytochrome [Candidatus Magnetaquicoccus inordinatus]|uniref:c-type cytochrome n=1 Tax=Candidatus Magnetaquicoccus inordinatus TaxID=2496818 RepID=UPI00102BC820|nr:cytochrome c [Candidatus Magnetaquicoccus inordinatus]